MKNAFFKPIMVFLVGVFYIAVGILGAVGVLGIVAAMVGTV